MRNAAQSGALGGLPAWGLCVRDDAGELCELRDTAPSPPALTKYERRTHERVKGGDEKSSGCANVFYFCFLAMLLLFLVLDVVRNGLHSVGTVVFWAAVVFISAIVNRGYAAFLNRKMRRHPESGRLPHEFDVIAPAMQRSLCPCCGYDLRGVPLDPGEPGGLRACPECGARWDLALWAREWPATQTPEWHEGIDGLRHWHTEDARGRHVRLLADLCDEDRTALRRAVCRSRWVEGLALIVLFAVLWVGTAAYLARLDPRLAYRVSFWRSFFLVPFVLVPLSLPLLYIRIKLGQNRWRHAITRARVGDGLCPSCGSGLSDAPTAIDGLLICQSCGSSWEPPKAGTPTLSA